MEVKVKNKNPQTVAQLKKGFQVGNKGGPGRPAGSKGRIEQRIREIGERNAEQILHILVDSALKGNMDNARFIADKFLPIPKGRRIELDVPNLDTVGNIDKAIQIIFQKVATGDLVVEEGKGLMSIIDFKIQSIVLKEQEARLEVVEQKLMIAKKD